MQSTMIVWTENESCDIALSFQEKVSCDELWMKICEVSAASMAPPIDMPTMCTVNLTQLESPACIVCKWPKASLRLEPCMYALQYKSKKCGHPSS